MSLFSGGAAMLAGACAGAILAYYLCRIEEKWAAARGLSDGRPAHVFRGIIEHLALGFLCAIAVTGLLGQAAIWRGARLDDRFWTGLVWAAAALPLPALWLGRAAILGFLSAPLAGIRLALARFHRAAGGVLPRSPLPWCFMILAILALIWLIQQAAGLPITGWDPLSFWLLKTKILLHEGTVRAPAFFAADRIHAHTTYPILVNIAEAGLCRAAGGFDETLLKIFYAAWWASCLIIIGKSLARRRGASVGWTGAALLAILPALTATDATGAVTGYRDALLAMLIAAAAAVWSDYLEESPPGARLGSGQSSSLGFCLSSGRPFLSGALILLLVLMMGCKREGGVWAALLGILSVFASLSRGVRKNSPDGWNNPRAAKPSQAAPPVEALSMFKRLAALFRAPLPRSLPWADAAVLFLAVPLLLMIPWWLLRAGMPYPRSEFYYDSMSDQTIEKTAARSILVLSEFRNELFLRVQRWGLLWWIFAGVCLWRRGAWSRNERLLAILIASEWLWVMASFAFTPWGDPLQHIAVSVDRLALQGAPLALWLTMLNLTHPLPALSPLAPVHPGPVPAPEK